MGRKRKMISVEEGLQHKLLPPCRVCDGPAGGFHYGVNTCEACKGFFHRSTKSTQTYRCDTAGKCSVHFKNSKICKKCRYAKCLSVGMGKHAIKTGRYTVEKRTQDTMELKKFCSPLSLDMGDNSANTYKVCVETDTAGRPIKCKESSENEIAQQNSCMGGISSAVSPSQLSNGFGRSTFSPGQETSCDSNDCIQEPHSDFAGPNPITSSKQSCNSFPSSSTPSTQGSLSSPETASCGNLGSPSMLSTSFPQQLESCSPYALHSASNLHPDVDSSNFQISSQPMQQGFSHKLNQNHISQQGLQKPSSDSPSMSCGFNDSHGESTSQNGLQSNTDVCSHCFDSNEEIYELYKDKDKVVDALLQAKAEHLEHLLPYMSEEELRKESLEHLETCRLRQEMFGQLTRLPDQEYDQIFESTGLDADGRQHRLGILSSLLEIHIRAQAKFAKCIPGFGLLSMEDQVTLIKYSRVEVLRVIGYSNVESELEVILCWDGKLRCKSEIVGEMCSNDMLSAYINLCIQYEKLKLNQQEKVLVAAIVLMAPDRVRHMACPKVQLIYELLNKCLIDVFEDRFERPLQKFAQVISMMIRFRTFGHISLKSLRQLRMDKYSNVKSNPLLRDMLAGLFFDEGEDEAEEFDGQPVIDNACAEEGSNSECT